MSLWDKFLPPTPPAEKEFRPSIAEVFGRTSVAYDERSFFAQSGGRRTGRPVSDSRDLQRVLELPSREKPDTAALAAALTARLSKGVVAPACICQSRFHRPCADKLKSIQAWGLHEAETVGGVLGPIGVGDGKTLLNLLTPMVMPKCKTALLLIPPDLKAQLLEVDWPFYEQHWHLPNLTTGRWHAPGRPYLHVVAFSELSSAKATDLLERINPDLIVVDEAHNLRSRGAARTKRFLRYMHGHQGVRLCAWSGTLTSKSLKDYAHLAALALGDKAPVPLVWPTVEEWASAIDPAEDFPAPIGKLAALCKPGEHIHEGFQRRLRSSYGVVASGTEQNCNASIVVRERPFKVPAAVEDALKKLRASWDRPDGEALVSGLDVARCARELAAGFFYRWRWPRKEPEEVRERWLTVRANWHRELREKLKHSREHLDSPLLLAKAAIRFHEGYRGELPTWCAEWWPEWVKVRDTAKPETETVWVDDSLAKDAAEWLKNQTGICWYEHDAFGRKVAELSGAPLYGPGEEASSEILKERGDRSIVASIRSHNKGKNLQMFSRNLVANPPGDGATWEQLVGRTHRTGQQADEVTVSVYRHTQEYREALDKARELASYIAGTMGGTQKLLRATFGWI